MRPFRRACSASALFLTSSLVAAAPVAERSSPSYRILVASNTDRVTSLLFDPNGPTLNFVSDVTVGTNPSWLAAHPNDSSLVFTGLEQPNGTAIALKYDDSGNGTIVGQVPCGGDSPASLLATMDALFVGNFASGNVAALPLSTTPPFQFLVNDPNAPNAILQLNGSGPNTDRQGSSHPHEVIAVPGRTELLVPDLGADRTWRLAYDRQAGTLTVAGQVEYTPGSGPRHVAFRENVLYTITELTSTLTAHSLPPLPGVPTLLSSTSSVQLPPGEPLGNQLAAELLLASALTGDGQIDNSSAPFLYATNRNDPSAEGDTLAIFSLQDPNTPSLVAEVHTGLQQLRGAAIVGENEQYIVMGGQTAGGVKVFERVDGGRSVKELAALPDIKAPTGFVWF